MVSSINAMTNTVLEEDGLCGKGLWMASILLDNAGDLNEVGNDVIALHSHSNSVFLSELLRLASVLVCNVLCGSMFCWHVRC